MCCIRVKTFELLKLLDIVGMYDEYCLWAQVSVLLMLGLYFTVWDRFCIWVELSVRRRLCPIFVKNVGSPDIHECFRRLTGSQRTPGFGASHGSS